MEKLEPILKQKFWILLGIGILMTITGWWLATGALAAIIDNRTKAVEEAFKSIPSGEIPNRDWTSKLAAVNAEQDKAVKETSRWLWEQQKSRMSWPETVAPFAWQAGYRGEIPITGRESYRTAYGEDVRRVWEIVRPFKPLYGTGIVVFGQSEKVLPQKTWGSQAPLSAEMWDAQEDLWLMESLLRTILDVNGGPQATRGDAFIHAIETLKLFGGVPAAQRTAGAGAAPGTPGAPGAPGMPGGAHSGGTSQPPSGGFGGGAEFGGGPRSGAASQGISTSEFDYKEDFGDDGSSKSGGGPGGLGGPMGSAAMGGPSGAHGGPAGGPGAAPGGAPGASGVSGVRRYIEDDEALPFKTRGFYMTLIMDHRKIPGLIAELSANGKSPWPVEVVRVQMVRVHDNDIDARIGAGGFGPGGGGGSGGEISLQSLLSSAGAGGLNQGNYGGASGVPLTPMPGTSSTFERTTTPEGGPNSAAISQAAAAIAALESALQEPFMARVSLAGVITLYKEVKPDPAPVAGAQPAPGQPGTQPATPAAPADANPAATGTVPETPDAAVPGGESPAAKPADPNGPAPANVPAPGGTPATTPPGAPADSNTPKPDEPQNPAPNAPASGT